MIHPHPTEDRTHRVRELAEQLRNVFDEHIRQVTAQFDLTPTQAAILRTLSTELTQRDVAKQLRCEPSNVTFVIDKLEERGLIERKPHPSDRRAKVLSLTPAGEVVREPLLHAFTANQPLAHLTDNELDTLEQVLSQAVATPPPGS